MKNYEFIKSNEPEKPGNTPWQPTYKWMAIAASSILVVLIITFFVLNIVLKPYMREIPLEITPWLDKSKTESKAGTPVYNEQGKENGETESANN